MASIVRRYELGVKVWFTGRLGNPFGRGISVLGLAAQVRRATGNGQELLMKALAATASETADAEAVPESPPPLTRPLPFRCCFLWAIASR